MTFFTLSANLGLPCAAVKLGDLICPGHGARIFMTMREIASLIEPACFGMDPIAVLEQMAAANSTVMYSPLIYGYVNYAIRGFRPNLIAFADIPAAGGNGPVGSALAPALPFPRSQPTVRPGSISPTGLPAERCSGDPMPGLAVNPGMRPPGMTKGSMPVRLISMAMRTTLEGAWVRPRHNGYMAFQQAASDRLNAGLVEGYTSRRNVIDDLNRLFRQSFAA